MDSADVPPSLRLAAAIAWRLLVIAAAIAVVALIVARLRVVFIPAFVALLLATQLRLPVDWLHNRGLPRAAAVLITLVAAAAVLLGIGLAVVGTLINDFDELEANFEGGLDRVGDWLVDLGVSQEDVEAAINDGLAGIRSNSDTLVGGLFHGASLALELVAGAALTGVLLFYFLLDGRRMWEWICTLLPAHRGSQINALGHSAAQVLAAYIRATAAVALFDAVLIGLVLLLIGVPLVIPLATITFFAAFVPIIGAVVAGLVAVLVALLSEGADGALLVLAAVVIVQQVEGNVLAPFLVGRSLAIHPVVIILAVTAGSLIWGVLGAVIAVPLVAVATIAAPILVGREEAPAIQAEPPSDLEDGGAS